MRDSMKKLLAVCAMGIAMTAFGGAAAAAGRGPGPGGPGAPQVQQPHQQIADGRHFRRGPPAHFRHRHYRRPPYWRGRRGHGYGYGYYRSYRAPRVHSGFNLVLQFGDSGRRSGGGYRGGGGGRH